MKNIRKIIILSTITILSLTACSEQQRERVLQKIKEKQTENAIKKLPKHDEPMPEYPQIKPPSELSNAEIDKNVQYVITQINEKSDKIIYFSKTEQKDGERDLVENKEDSEYYRTILGTTLDGNCVVQDFYSENDAKQMEPMIVKQEGCNSWKSDVFDGMTIWYEKDGKIENKTNGVTWIKQGKIAKLLRQLDDSTTFYSEEVRPNVYRKSYLIKQKPQDAFRDPAFICEYNAKTNQIELAINFAYTGITEKYDFVNNKANINKVTSWTPDGRGFIDTISAEKEDMLNKTYIGLCGVREEKSDK
ncbi:MAG: hypothetical protein IK065_01010 [Neisseriaceae bacterium]|nr:hypothetical protein [Neisseriaceae bacterium]